MRIRILVVQDGAGWRADVDLDPHLSIYESSREAAFRMGAALALHVLAKRVLNKGVESPIYLEEVYRGPSC